MNGPSPRQLVVLRAIRDHQKAKGFAPTIRELGDQLGIKSTNGVHEHLRLLIRKGLLTREKQRSRTLLLTTAGQREIQEAAP